MRLSVHAVGRMKAGPERELADRYFGRLAKAGPAIGLDFAGVAEIAESRARDVNERRREEAAALAAHRTDAALFLLDERGKNPSSEDFAARIAALRDEGRKHLVLAIGGPDGHDAASRQAADYVLSFGAQTWPHQLVRVMLAEQLYRAVTILSGHPYHRA
ncbi:MAG: 23S rRNA (pseudouridine(1915)-N(3))-methyltransferase RlmH [Aquamicrobium sp.]|uniref:23S rRNA (pseudouridine(1915)-N(3))-methyltransferase RlmH n=1 Tax=Aquamicrobium sp. TaxID=1872579 RepID=UPI00349F0436|nr:23S rRNA (pseudouridine(1915)-N(3))-methyltransferase RlmH [Aquamicrobium sp.]